MSITKGIEFKATYKGDLSGLKNDLLEIDKHRARLMKQPIMIPVKLDFSGMDTQIKTATAKINAAMSAASSGKNQTTSAGGITIPDSALKDWEKLSTGVGGAVRKITTDVEGLRKAEQTFKKLSDGVIQQTKTAFTYDKDGNQTGSKTTVTTDNQQRVAKFKRELADIENETGKDIGKASGLKDKAKEIDLLTKKAEDLKKLLNQVNEDGSKNRDLSNESVYRKAESTIAATEKRIASLGGDQKYGGQTAAFDKQATALQKQLTTKLKLNDLETAKATAIANAAEREARINALLEQRKQILRDTQTGYNDLDKKNLEGGRGDLAGKANAKSIGLQRDLDKIEKTAAQGQSKEKILARVDAYDRELATLKRITAEELQRSKNAEKAARKLPTIEERQRALEKVSQERAPMFAKAINQLNDLAGRADKTGDRSTVRKVETARNSLTRQSITDLDKLTAHIQKNGHAIDFHSSGLLRNAATFAKWSAAMQLVMLPIQAFQAGIKGMIEVNSQFAALRAVFRGSEEDTQKLKEGVIELGVAQGQSAQTAMDAAIRWSRLGLTRVQVLQAVETSLVAANVAEMSAADAAESLSGIYATWKINLSDVATVLDQMNAISNRYNATNKDLIDGLVAVGAVAKQAGMSLLDTQGLIASGVGAGFSGSTVGNTAKFVMQRIRDPKTIEKLQDELNIDLTGPQGEIKDMTTIMEELARIYPTLSRNQQTLLLNTTAGSRQAARFAVLLENQTQAQILAAEAAFDAGSAMNENEKILDSLQSRIESIKTSWIEMAVAVGDTGFLNLIADALTNTGDSLSTFTGLIDKLQGATKTDGGEKIKLRNRDARQGMDDSTVFSRAQARIMTAGISDVARQFRSNEYSKDDITSRLAELKKDGGPKEQIEALQRALDELDSGNATSQISNVGKEMNDLQQRVEAFSRGAEVFDSLGQSVRDGSSSREKLLRDWTNAATLLTYLNDGSKKFAENYGKISTLISQGKNEEAATLIQGFSKDFKSQEPEARAAALEKQKELSQNLHGEYGKLIEQQDALIKGMSGLKGDELIEQQKRWETVKDAIKTAQDAILAVDQSLEKVAEAKGLDPAQMATLKKGLTETLDPISKFSKALSDLDQGSDPARKTQQKLDSLRMEEGFLKNILTLTKEQAQASGDTDAARDTVATVQAKLTSLQQANEEKRKEIALQEQINRLQEADRQGRENVDTRYPAFLVGKDRSAQIGNQTQTLFDGNGLLLKRTTQTGEQEVTKRSELLQREKTIQDNLLSLKQRDAQITAEIGNREFRILDLKEKQLEAAREQTREQSKRLALASREDQLRAAMAAAATQGGKLGMDEFSYLSQSTRQNFDSFNQSRVTGLGGRDDSDAKDRKKFDKEEAKLEEEQKRVREQVSGITTSLGNFKAAVDDYLKNNPLTAEDVDAKPGAAQDLLDRNPNVTINNGGVNIDITAEWSRFTTALIDNVKTSLDSQLTAIRTDLAALRTPAPSSTAFTG